MSRLEDLKTSIIDGDERAVDLTRSLLAEGSGPKEILEQGLLPGMDVVGERMRTGACFIPEVLLSARTMQACLDLVKPLLTAGERSDLPTVVIGTVEGDIHDIGKNLVAMLLEGAGFEVVDVGKSVSVPTFVEAVEKHGATILGMSALLTTTLPRMQDAIEALKAAGLRDGVKVIVGGAPVSQAYADEIGADAYGQNAASAVDRCRELAHQPVQAGR